MIFNLLNYKIDNCIEIIIIIFNVIRDDNGVLFWCLFYNSLIVGVSRDLLKILVLCMYKLLDIIIICVDF